MAGGPRADPPTVFREKSTSGGSGGITQCHKGANAEISHSPSKGRDASANANRSYPGPVVAQSRGDTFEGDCIDVDINDGHQGGTHHSSSEGQGASANACGPHPGPLTTTLQPLRRKAVLAALRRDLQADATRGPSAGARSRSRH
eukprot:TRINITY_DN115031_c0_g1_i1.p2 TRINITY_DN115031_c0_g1~~TRINITY_DN115031_c0_g1_i1.p2  ORF type:complete len:145 (+),score=7.09 TRINITY_DN115031_c0_g1_i1:48-482(+)